MCGLGARPRHDDLRGRDRLARPARPLRRGRRQPGRHRGRLHRRSVGADHRPVAGVATGGRHRARRPGHEGPLPDGSGPERPRPLGPPPDPRPGRLPAAPRRGGGRSLPGACLGPAHAADRDAAHPGRLRAGRQDPLLRAVELHRLAAHQGRAHRARPGALGAGDAAAAVQPDRPRDRVGDRARRPRRRPGPAAVVSPGRWLAVRQVPPRPAPDRRDPARRGPRPGHGGLGTPRHRTNLADHRGRRADRRGGPWSSSRRTCCPPASG
jgi:hypothetical protein